MGFTSIAGKQGEVAIFLVRSEFYLLTVLRGLTVEVKIGAMIGEVGNSLTLF